jgi:hypothetical protein
MGKDKTPMEDGVPRARPLAAYECIGYLAAHALSAPLVLLGAGGVLRVSAARAAVAALSLLPLGVLGLWPDVTYRRTDGESDSGSLRRRSADWRKHAGILLTVPTAAVLSVVSGRCSGLDVAWRLVAWWMQCAALGPLCADRRGWWRRPLLAGYALAAPLVVVARLGGNLVSIERSAGLPVAAVLAAAPIVFGFGGPHARSWHRPWASVVLLEAGVWVLRQTLLIGAGPGLAVGARMLVAMGIGLYMADETYRRELAATPWRVARLVVAAPTWVPRACRAALSVLSWVGAAVRWSLWRTSPPLCSP